MSFARKLLRNTFTAIIALVLLFEEWGWEPLAALFARLARLPFFAWLEQRVRLLPPYAALVALCLPALALLPVKIAALYFIARGHGGMGLAVLLAAKFIGTALLAWLFALTQPTLMRLAWFARWYPRWKAWKDRVMDDVRRSAVWQAARRMKASVASQWDDFRRALRDPP
jgi:hypothetical protein